MGGTEVSPFSGKPAADDQRLHGLRWEIPEDGAFMLIARKMIEVKGVRLAMFDDTGGNLPAHRNLSLQYLCCSPCTSNCPFSGVQRTFLYVIGVYS